MFNVIDLFSGAGGLSEGFQKEGFSFIAHVEKDFWACETIKTRIIYHKLTAENNIGLYNEYIIKRKEFKNPLEYRNMLIRNMPELKWTVDNQILNMTFGNPEEDLGSTSIKEIVKTIWNISKIKSVTDVDLVIGGPPCQSYSIVGRGRMGDGVMQDKRNFLFHYFKEIVEEFKPKILIFENVPGITSAGKGVFLNRLQDEFNQIGYHLKSGEDSDHKKNFLDVSKFGVPQKRRRFILVGFRKDLFSRDFSYPDFKKNKSHDVSDGLTTRDAIGDLPVLQIGEGEDHALLAYPTIRDLSSYQKMMRLDSVGVVNHRARLHSKSDREIYRTAIRHASRNRKLLYAQLPEKLRTHKNTSVFSDRFKVHRWDKTPHTIVAHIAKDGHYNIHPDIDQCRSLTVREAARIQSFPDNYIFEGPRTSQYTQVGNAVPPLIAQAIARSISEILENLNKIKSD